MGGIPAWPDRISGGWGRGRKSWGGMGPVSLRGNWGRSGVHTYRGPHSWWGDQQERVEAFGGSGIGGECGQHLPCLPESQWNCWGSGPETLPSSACSSHADPEPKLHNHNPTPPPGPFPAPSFFFFFSIVVLFCFVVVSFLFFLIYILFFILCYCSAPFCLLPFYFVYFFFLPCHMTCGILAPRAGVRHELQWCEHWVQTTGLAENLRPQRILIGVNSPRGPHLDTKTQLHPTACKPKAKQQVRQEQSLTHKKKKKMTKNNCYRETHSRWRSKVKTHQTKQMKRK